MTTCTGKSPGDWTWPDLIALDAVGVLPAAEAERLRAHLRDCESCAQEAQGDRASADLVAHIDDDSGPAPSRPEELRERVMQAARAARAPVSAATTTPSVGYAHVIGFDAFVECAPGIRWAVTRTEGTTLVTFALQPPECGIIPDELHPGITQSGVVLEGSFSMRYGDGTVQRLTRGDSYTIAPGTMHGATVHEPTKLFEVFTPNHTEYEELYARQLRERDGART